MNYQEAGVDVKAGDAFVRSIMPLALGTNRAGVMGSLGGFGAIFDPKAAGFADPLLVSSTDGVGTKLKVAIATGRHDTIGIDLVAMCVNDLIVHGATPLFFLDYYASGKLDQGVALEVARGIAAGCTQAHCALIGGETAEMPGLYAPGEYDLAGFALGAVEREKLLPANVMVGDVLIGLPSRGVHSNGYSLARHIVATAGVSWDAAFDATRSFGDCFLTPTRIYVPEILALCEQNLLHAAAHITGGGLIGNVPRVIPDGLTVRIDQPWPVPTEFGWLRHAGKVSDETMLSTFNCGIGMVLVVPSDKANSVLTTEAVVLGEVISGSQPSIRLPTNEWWL